MLLSELPPTAFPIHKDAAGAPVMWADRATRKVYARDMLNLSLINSRDYTEDEAFKADEEIAKEKQIAANIKKIDSVLSPELVDALLGIIGPPLKLADQTDNPAIVASTTSINEMLKYTNQEFNAAFAANPAVFTKQILRWLKRDMNASIAVVKKLQGILDSANVGA